MSGIADNRIDEWMNRWKMDGRVYKKLRKMKDL